MQRNNGIKSGSQLFILAAAVIGTSPATAQLAPGASAEAAAPSDQTSSLGEIVVTAQRRSELQRDVPIAITTIGPDQLQQADAHQLGDIAQVAPALRFDGTGQFVQPTIRGVGTAVATSGGGANVGIYIDGFYSPNPLAANFELLNVESMQVLKGPQGTLFGRNTTGGAILITTGAPSRDSSVTAQADFSNFSTQRYQAYATTGIGDKLAVDIEGLFTKGDGFVHNIYNGADNPSAFKNWSVRTGVKFDPTDDLSFLFRYQHQGTDDPTNLLGSTYVSNGRPLTIGTVRPGTVIATAFDEVSNSKAASYGGSYDSYQLTSTLDLPFATLTSYSQGRFEKGVSHYNLEGSSASYFSLIIPIFDRTLSQEFLLASKGSGPLQWTAGAFLFDYSDQYENVQESILGGAFRTFTYSGTDTRSYAAYADATYEVVHNLFLTAGARYTHDEVDDAFFTNVSAAKVSVRTNVSPVKTDTGTPRAVVRYKFTEFSSVYASFSQGYKAPILNVGGGNLNGIRVEPEHINAYEIGYKYGHGPLSADIAAYHYDYRDLQVAAQIGTASLINNAATARISGADGQVQYDVGDGVQLNVGAAYTDAKYGRYPNSASYVQCLNQTTCGASYGVFAVVPINASGNEMQRAPQFTGNLGARYSHTLAQGNLVLSGNFYDTSRVYFDSSNNFHQNAYNVTNLRAEWTDPSTRYTLALYTDNVTDTHYLSEVPTSNFGIRGIWAYPRTYGVSVRVHLK